MVVETLQSASALLKERFVYEKLTALNFDWSQFRSEKILVFLLLCKSTCSACWVEAGTGPPLDKMHWEVVMHAFRKHINQASHSTQIAAFYLNERIERVTDRCE